MQLTSNILHSVASVLALVPCSLTLGSTCSARDAYQSALERFTRKTPEAFVAGLVLERPPVLPDGLRAQVIAALPKEGEVRGLNAEDQRKLDAVVPVLRAHCRERVYLLKVVAAIQARLALHARFIVLITQDGLRALTPATLRAAVAHEIGHEYVWDEYEEARKRGDWDRLRELELYCDGLAVLTLAQIGADPSDWITGLNSLYAADRAKGIPDERAEQGWYPSPAERRKFMAEVRAWLTGSTVHVTSCLD